MRASEFPAHHIAGRATTGQRLEIRYDPSTNALVFEEDDWTADARGGASARTMFREQLSGRNIAKRRRAA